MLGYNNSTSANDSINNFIFLRTLAGPFLLVATLLSHVLVIALTPFREILLGNVVQTLRTDFRRQGVTGARNYLVCGSFVFGCLIKISNKIQTFAV